MRTAVRRALSAAVFVGSWLRGNPWAAPYVAIFLFLLGATVVSSLVGCGSLLPTEDRSLVKQESRESIAGQTTAGVVSAATVQPPDVTITTTAKDGTTVQVKQPAATETTTTANTTASETSDASASGEASQSTTIPMFVKLIGSAVGLGLLWLVFWLWRRTSKAVNAAFAAGDDLAARGIHSVRSLAATLTSPEDRARVLALAGDMERDRTNWHREP